VRTAAREALTEMDAMLGGLQAVPIENVGLVEALRTQCDALGFRTGVAVTLDVQPLPPAHLLPPGAQEAIFRVAQEALANIARHARARHAAVRLDVRRRNLVLEIVDDGTGFNPMAHRTGMGIGNMQSRTREVSGRFQLASSPGEGTSITFSVPFAARPPERYLLLSAAFTFALIGCAVLLAGSGGGSLRPWWIAGVYITAIAAARYLVAFLRVRRRAPEAP
jgi:signal transduction histidine kinase